jgi:hypothetical protein
MKVELSMTRLLEQAFHEAAKRPDPEQDLLASRLLAELAAENAFDNAIEQTASKLAKLSQQAIEDHRAGRTEELDPDRL